VKKKREKAARLSTEVGVLKSGRCCLIGGQPSRREPAAGGNENWNLEEASRLRLANGGDYGRRRKTGPTGPPKPPPYEKTKKKQSRGEGGQGKTMGWIGVPNRGEKGGSTFAPKGGGWDAAGKSPVCLLETCCSAGRLPGPRLQRGNGASPKEVPRDDPGKDCPVRIHRRNVPVGRKKFNTTTRKERRENPSRPSVGKNHALAGTRREGDWQRK